MFVSDLVPVMDLLFYKPLLILVVFWLDVTVSQNASSPTYKIWDETSGMTKTVNSSSRDTHVYSLEESRISLTNLVNIDWLNSTTSTISISWGVSASYVWRGYAKHSTVECFTSNGRFTSHPLPSSIKEYTFVNLDANTLYSICVNVIEARGPQNASETVHSKCVKINTIDYIRRENVIWMLVVVGYYFFMGLLGYTQWRRKLWTVRAKNRRNDAADNHCYTTAVRWRDLAERERLYAAEGSCSIEDRSLTS